MKFLVIDDDKPFRDVTCSLIEQAGHYVEGFLSGSEALKALQEEQFDGVLLELNLGQENGLDVLSELLNRQPRLSVVMIAVEGSPKVVVEAMRRGAVDFLEKPFQQEHFMTVLGRLQRERHAIRRNSQPAVEIVTNKRRSSDPVFHFTTSLMKETMDVLLRAAKTPASILILGESGTGKSVAARAVHQHSHLAEKPFVTVSCPSLSKELLESELFGHVKGSFTGAIKDHWGKVKAAEGGTMFLDEIGDLPLEIQPKLLRLLQEKEYERLGENVTRTANLRIIAATNRDLKKRVAEGLFREDLYFRLNVITVEMPPLRSRDEDIAKFAELYQSFFAEQCGRELGGFPPETVATLQAYAWPGNLRELRNAIERAVVLCNTDCLRPNDFPAAWKDHEMNPATSAVGLPQLGQPVSLETVELVHMQKVIERAPSLAHAARVLGINQATLYRKRKLFGIRLKGTGSYQKNAGDTSNVSMYGGGSNHTSPSNVAQM